MVLTFELMHECTLCICTAAAVAIQCKNTTKFGMLSLLLLLITALFKIPSVLLVAAIKDLVYRQLPGSDI